MKNPETKAWFMSKTLWTNVVIVGLAIVDFVQNQSLSPTVLMLAGIANIVLRFISNQTLTLKSNN